MMRGLCQHDAIHTIESLDGMPVADKLEAIKELIKDLVDEALQVVQKADQQEYRRAKGYWAAHVQTALDNEHSYLGGSMCTMQDTIDSLSCKSGDRCFRCGQIIEEPPSSLDWDYEYCFGCAPEHVRERYEAAAL